MIRRLGFCLFLLLLSSPVQGQRRRPPQRGVPGYFQALKAIEDDGTRGRIVLKNGLRVLVDEYTIRPLVAVVSAFNVGRAQASGPEFLSELGHRLWLTGDLSRRAHELGGWNEFQSGLYETSFISIVPADNVLDTLTLHQQILTAPFSEAGPAPAAPPAVDSSLEARLWTESFGESEQSSAELPKEEALKAFREKYLHVGNLVLAVSGRVLRTNVYERVVTLYARFKAGEQSSRPAVSVNLGKSFGYLHVRERSPATRILMGYRVPGEGHPDAPSIEMIESLLSGGRGSLLPRTQVAAGYSARAEASLVGRRQQRLLQIDLSPLDGKVDSAELGVLSLLAVLGSQGPPQADLVRAKSQLVRQYFEERQHIRDRALGMCRSELTGSYKTYWDRARLLASVDVSQIKKVASHYFTQENLVVVEQFPESGEIRNFTATTLQQTFQLLLPAEQEKLAEELSTTPEAESKDLAFSEFKPVFLDYPLKRTSVLRGPDIYLEEEHTVPIVSAGFYFPGGRAEETEQTAGITEVMLRSLLAGVEEKAGIAVWMPFETRGARFEMINEPEYFGIEVTVLADAFAPLLKEMVGWFQEPAISEKQFERVRAEVMALGEAARDRPETRADLEIRAKLFGDHPYGRSRFGNPSSLSRLTIGAVRGWASRQLMGFHPFIVIRGHLKGTSFLPPLIPVLSNSKLKVKPAAEVAEPKGASHFLVQQGDRIWVGFPGPRRGSFDAWAIDVLKTLILLRNGVLPADASLEPLDSPVQLGYRDFFKAGVLTVSTESKEPADQTEKKLLKILSQLEQAPLREQELLRAVVLAITRYHLSQEDSASHLRELAHNLLGGEKIGYREEYLATIKGLQPSDLRSLAGRLFGETGVNPEEGTSP